MSRPRSQGLAYFPHDTDALSDEKVERLTILDGSKGYMFYFGLLERIYRQPDFELDISDPETRQILAIKLCITNAEFEAILKTALKCGCFDPAIYNERRCLTSAGIKKRANVVIEKRLRMRDLYKSKKVSDAGTSAVIAKTTAETPQSIVKERIVKDSIVSGNSLPNEQPEDISPVDAEKIKDIVLHLNAQTAASYKPTSRKTIGLIKARFNEDFAVEDFKHVIDKKVAEWKGDPKMCTFLRPETLFGSKFEGYLNAPDKQPDWRE